MSYRCINLTVSPEFFEKHSKCITVEPDDAVFKGSISSGHPMDFSQNADSYRKNCSCIFLRDVGQFLTEDMQKFVEEHNLFAFAYLYNNENRSKHVRVIISQSDELKMVWVRYAGCFTWPYLELVDVQDKGVIGLIDYVNSGVYSTYIYGVAQLGSRYASSRFDFVDRNKPGKKPENVLDKPLEIIETAGLEALKNEFHLSIEA